MVTTDRERTLERHGRLYGEHCFAIAWTAGITGDDAKACRRRGWETTRPEPADFLAGVFTSRGLRANPCLVLAPSGLVGVDVDGPVGAARMVELLRVALPGTVTVLSGRDGGMHYWFRAVSETTHHKLEFKSDGSIKVSANGYFVAPPALHPTGREYRFADGHALGEIELAEMPLNVLEAIVKAAGGDRRERVEHMAAGERVAAGARHDALCSHAGSLRRAGLGEGAILEGLWTFFNHHCELDPPADEDHLASIAHSAATWAPGELPNGIWWRKASPNGSKPTEHPTFVLLEDVVEKEVSWLWDRRVPWASVTLIAGDGAAGKSTLSQQIGTHMTNGESPKGGGELDRARGVVLLSGEEDAAAVIRPRMRLAGADLSKVMVLSTEEAGFTLPSGMDELSRICREFDAGMVIVDTGPSFLDPDLKSNLEEDIRRMLRPLRSLAEELRLVVIIICHLNKRDGGDSRQRVMGGAAWVNAARSVLYVGAPPGEDPRATGERMVAVEKSNLGAYPPAMGFLIAPAQEDQRYPVVIWNEEVEGVFASDLVRPPQSPEDRSALEEAVEFIRSELDDGPAPVGDLQKAATRAGISWVTIKRAKKAAGARSEKSALAGGWRWILVKGIKGTPIAPLVPFEGDQPSEGDQPNSFIDRRGSSNDTSRARAREGTAYDPDDNPDGFPF